MPQTATRQKKIQLIAQMLAKAESTTPEEAEALTEAAESLMLAYQIESAELQAESDATVEVIELVYVLDRPTYAQARRWSLCLALNGLGQVSSYYRSNRSTGLVALVIVGVREDAEQALRLVESLDRQQMHALKVWWANEKRWWTWATKGEQLAERRSYLIGYGKGVEERLSSAREAIMAEISESTAMVLVGNRALADEHINTLEMRGSRERNTGSSSSHGEGRAAGREANTSLGHELQQEDVLELAG